jgi:hypothetical protein
MTGSGQASQQASLGPMPTSEAGDDFEVVVRLPRLPNRLIFSFDVGQEPGGIRGESPADRAVTQQMSQLVVAGGRKLPKLLFATSLAGLAANIGRAEARHALTALTDAGITVMDDVDASSWQTATAAVRNALTQDHYVGVVLLGGYDVIPSVQTDALDSLLRRRVAGASDADGYVIWSDDRYGDVDGDGLAELPVSRIPDGRTASLVFSALGALGSQASSRAGIRNDRRPFAEPIFQLLPGAGSLLASQPAHADSVPPPQLDGDHLYLMLHGADTDATRFWGETDEGMVEAIRVEMLPRTSRAVTFAGCCWGALSVREPARVLAPNQAPTPRAPETSIALSMLAAGAQAFVGCTGAHYSPVEEPYGYFGGPMHQAFWDGVVNGGLAPAAALFEAKAIYARKMPHGQDSPIGQAIERKTFFQFTCLGLGW